MPIPSRTFAVLLAAPLATLSTGCSTTPVPGSGGSAAQSPVVTGDAVEGSCDAKAASAYVGQAINDQVANQAKASAGARGVRIIRPGMAVTMDYRAGRLNLEVDAEGRIIRASCG